MQFYIESATMDMSGDIAQLTAELGYTTSVDETKHRLEALLGSSTHCVLVAVSDSNVCGWLVVEKRLFLESGCSAEITGLVVGKAFRRRGIANALVSAAEQWACSLGLTRLVVRSNAARKESHDFYPSAGFSHTKTSQVYVKPLI
ncbi:Ribosomal protein S18 acetylase RimI [Vibrio xiamenensis]|uniref:Ribosomal protein S18 acetylase RimI n=1 Tax=Vibrio xiamenensis TaxID=861298 RepID=A0A1G8GB62_9VIBR|nr:GNAT family N-acetyltransferase [Vibrio xiamenensis]SDH91662.1 Ribosomal protein S18 acetylase RimI [Vibrio xiamenensis]